MADFKLNGTTEVAGQVTITDSGTTVVTVSGTGASSTFLAAGTAILKGADASVVVNAAQTFTVTDVGSGKIWDTYIAAFPFTGTRVIGFGGPIWLSPDASASAGHSVLLSSGAAGGTDQDGGTLYLRPGAKTGTGADGTVIVQSAASADVLTVAGSLVSSAVPISVTSGGAAVATGALINLPRNSTLLVGRNEADTGNISILGTNSSNELLVGGTGGAGGVTRLLAPSSLTLQVSSGTIVAVNTNGADWSSGKRANFLGELDISRNGTPYITSAAGLVTVTQDLAVGAGTAASSGVIRLPNGALGNGRSTGGSNMRWLEIGTDDVIRYGDVSFNTAIRGSTSVNFLHGGTYKAGILSGPDRLNFIAGLKVDWSSGTAALSIAGTDWMTGTVALTTVEGNLAVTAGGSPVAQSAGVIRVPRSFNTLQGRNQANTADTVLIGVDSSDGMIVGEDTNISAVSVRAAGNVVLRSASANIAIAKAGELELQAAIKLDWASGTAALSIGGTNWLTSTTTTITPQVQSLSWANNVTTPTITQGSETTTANADSMFITAQWNTNGTSGDAGNVVISGGQSTAGTDGGVSLRTGATTRIQVDATGIGVFATTPVAKQTVTGSRGGNAALASFLTAMAAYGWITDSSTA